MEQSMMIETLLGSAAFIILIGVGAYFAFRSNKSAPERDRNPPNAVHRNRPRAHDYRVHGRPVR